MQLLARLQQTLDQFQIEGHSDDTGAVALRPSEVEAVLAADLELDSATAPEIREGEPA